MPLVISDEQLREAHLGEQEARVEFACQLFATGRLALWPAARLAGLNRADMEVELLRRGLPIYRPSVEDLAHDLASLDKLGI